ncbi:hypothetical protein BH20ACI2_BH20ACI2_00800 [soil metagenome]
MIKSMKFIAITFSILILASVSFAQKTPTMTVKVFFHNEKLNPEMKDCNKSFPNTRTIQKTRLFATAALNEFFKGATEEEKA